MSKFDIMDYIHKQIIELKTQNIEPGYISVDTTAMVKLMRKFEYETPEIIFGLKVLYNPQQKTLVRILAKDLHRDFTARKEKFL